MGLKVLETSNFPKCGTLLKELRDNHKHVNPPGRGSVFQKISYTDWGKPQQSLVISILQNVLLHLFCTSNEGEKVVSLWAECKKCNMGLCTVAYKTTKQNWNPDILTKGRSSELQKLLLHKYVIRQVCYASSNMILNKHTDTKIWHIAATTIWSLITEVFLHGVLLKLAWRVHSNEN